MAILVLIFATYIAAVLQTSLAPVIEVRHVMPDLFALVAVVWMLRAAGPLGFIALAFVGLAYDLTSTGSLGVGLGLYSLVGYLLTWLSRKLDRCHLLLALPIIWLAASLITLGEAAAARFVGETALAWTTLAVRAVSVGVYTAALALPVLMVLGWLPQKKAVSM
jgi:rod shape-determining protein MreD